MNDVDERTSHRSTMLGEVIFALRRTELLAELLTEAHDLGVAPGDVDAPWDIEAQRRFHPIYAAVFPDWYRGGVAAWFERVANELVTMAAPPAIAGHWSVAEHYFRSVSSVIREGTDADPDIAAFVPRQSPPSLLDYRAIASIVSSDGLRRLGEAIVSVRGAVEALASSPLGGADAALIRLLAGGTSIDEAARREGYSRRTVYRMLARLQADVGANSRAELVAIAVTRGWVELPSE